MNKVKERQVLLLNNLKGETQREYYVDLFMLYLVETMKAQRKKKGLTQVETAERMGVQASFLARVENCERDPTLNFIARYGYAIGVLPDHLIAMIVPEEKDTNE